jgi:hypothetical protein
MHSSAGPERHRAKCGQLTLADFKATRRRDCFIL